MSIIERSNPLNLQFRVCIVTCASSTLGVIICKNLLKSNAFVLGVDTRAKDPSLNAGSGTHFQFEQCDLNDSDTPQKLVATAKENFRLERIDALINIVEEGAEANLDAVLRLTQAVGQAMEQADSATVINVVGNSQGTKSELAIDFCKQLASQSPNKKIRYNVVQAGGKEEDESSKSYRDSRIHMKEIMRTERTATKMSSEKSRYYDIGNVTLFLAGDLGKDISGAVVYSDGSFQTL